MGEKHGKSGRGGVRGERHEDSPVRRYEDSFERSVDEFERARELEEKFEDPEGWLGEHANYWTDTAVPRPGGERSLRLRRLLERLGGLWSTAGKGRGDSRLDGDGWPAARATFEGVPVSKESSPSRPANWRDAAWDLRLAQESRADRASRRLADLWDRLLGVERGMSRLEEAGRKKHAPEAWISLGGDGASSAAEEAELARAVADALDPPEIEERSPPRPFARREMADRDDAPRRSPLRNEFRLDGDGWGRPLADGSAGRLVPIGVAKDELAAFFALARAKAGRAEAGAGGDSGSNLKPRSGAARDPYPASTSKRGAE